MKKLLLATLGLFIAYLLLTLIVRTSAFRLIQSVKSEQAEVMELHQLIEALSIATSTEVNLKAKETTLDALIGNEKDVTIYVTSVVQSHQSTLASVPSPVAKKKGAITVDITAPDKKTLLAILKELETGKPLLHLPSVTLRQLETQVVGRVEIEMSAL